MQKVKPKARYGSGSIFRKEGTKNWTLQYFVNGRRKRESSHTGDKQAAQQLLTVRLGQCDKGEIIVANKKLFVHELFAELEAEYRRQRRKTLKDVQGKWNLHVKKHFGDMLALNVTKDHIKNYQDLRIQEGAKPASVNRETGLLKTSFRLAKDKLPRLPIFPRELKEDPPRMGFVEDVQFDKLKSCVGPDELWLHSFLEIAYTLGWRTSEILGLQVKQIDFVQRTIRLETGTTKSGKPREASMNERVYQLVKECCLNKGKEDYVLTRTGGKRVRDFRRRWIQLREAAGFPKLIVHDFRRSAARNLRSAGVAESVIMKMCGWDTAQVFRRYAIVSKTDKQDAMEKLDAQRLLDEAKRKSEANSPRNSPNLASSEASGSSVGKEWMN